MTTVNKEQKMAIKTKKDGIEVITILSKPEFAKDLPKTLVAEMAEALKAPAKVTKEALESMIAKARKALQKKLAQVSAPAVAVENSLKPAPSKSGKPAPAPAKEAPKGKLAPAPAKQAPAKNSKQAPAKEAPKKKSGVTTAPAVRKTDVPVAKFFPETIESEDLGTLVRADKKYKTYKAIAKAIEEGAQLVIACYWTKRHIKEFDYALSRMVACPKSFDNDLDLVQAIVACQNVDRIFGMSVYTEALYQFEGASFEAVEDVDPATGETFKVRVSNGMEFEVYEVQDEEAEDTEE